MVKSIPLIASYDINKYLEALNTLSDMILKNHVDSKTKYRFNRSMVSQFINAYDFDKIPIDKNNFDWVKKYGSFILHAATDYLMQNKDSNTVYASYTKSTDTLDVYFNFPNLCAKIEFCYLPNDMIETDRLMAFLEGDDPRATKSEYVEIELKRTTKSNPLFNVTYENNRRDLIDAHPENNFILNSTQNNAIRCAHKMYDEILKYCICMYFGVIDENNYSWKELLKYGLYIC